MLQAAVCAVTFSAVLGVLTWCCAPVRLFRNPFIAGFWGLFIGLPAGIAFVGWMKSFFDDE